MSVCSFREVSMAATTMPVRTDWRNEWFEIEDATYLNFAGQSAMPKVSFRAVQTAVEWKKFANRLPDSAYFDVPDRVRSSIAKLIGAHPDEVALTTGASTGMSVVAYGLSWKPGDEVITAKGEFPLQYTTWKPMEAREGITVKVIAPRDRFITADDLIAAMTPKTRLISVSMVRFDDGSLVDAKRLAAACHAQGALLLLDVSQCCGGLPPKVEVLRVVFMGCAGYKWLPSPQGTGFLRTKSDHAPHFPPRPQYRVSCP